MIEGSNIVTVTYDGPLRAEELVAARERLRTVIRVREQRDNAVAWLYS